MDNENPNRGDEEEPPGEQPEWKVEGEESMDSMLEQTPPSDASYDGGGMMIFTDEQGRRRRIPAERGTMSGRDLGAAAQALQKDLGAATSRLREGGLARAAERAARLGQDERGGLPQGEEAPRPLSLRAAPRGRP